MNQCLLLTENKLVPHKVFQLILGVFFCGISRILAVRVGLFLCFSETVSCLAYVFREFRLVFGFYLGGRAGGAGEGILFERYLE